MTKQHADDKSNTKFLFLYRIKKGKKKQLLIQETIYLTSRRESSAFQAASLSATSRSRSSM